MTYRVEINGIKETVKNSYSCGPGCPAHTYDLTGGRWVMEIAGIWTMHQPGREPQQVKFSKID